MRGMVVCVLALFSTAPAFAQEVVAWERFFPGEVDDFWRFEEVSRWCIVFEDETCQTTTVSRTYRVVDRVETAGSIVIELQVEDSRCRLSIAEGTGWFTVEQITGEKCLPLGVPAGSLNFPTDETAGPGVVSINGFDHTVAGLKWFGEFPFWGHRFAADLGMYEYFSTFWVDNQRFEDFMTLTRATVNGVAYGVPVAAEPDASGAPARLDVYPNPFRDRLVLRLEEVCTVVSRLVTVEVYDLLGQRVRTEDVATDVAVLDLGSLAPGYYVIRVMDAGATVSTRRVTKLR